MDNGREDSFSVEEEDWTSCDNEGREEEEMSGERGSDEELESLESGMRMEEMATPSWLFILHADNEVGVAFTCLCNECEWKGEEETQLALHLQGHVHSVYGGGSEDGMDGRWEGGDNDLDALFVACPIPFCNRAFSIHAKCAMASHMSMHAHHASLQKKGFIALNSKAEFTRLRSCGRKEKLVCVHAGDAHVCMWDDCDITFLDINEFFSHVLSHMEFVHDGNCLWDSCTHKFKQKSRLLPHVHHHMGMKAGACPFCGEVFSSFSKLYDHIARRMGEDALRESVLCKLCRKAFPNEKSLRLHAKRHVVRVRCDECGVLFSSKHDLTRHWGNVHPLLPLSPQLICSFPNCSSTFTSNSKLMQHLKRHSEGGQTCPYCTREFRWAKQLTKHINLEHNKNGIPQYVCHVCDGQYEEGSSLSRHLKKKHSVALPPGFPRFQYKKCEDGMYRLQTNRPYS
ncbi:hypothetical protein PMAYCL1PPCAC_23959 [Pristionchus mayeri]|uniref:C2H2-type domain-containing protein n=1 Tax=Pristionchus mayeri TaxID=1317129 RepID=A0AAN5CZX2_9BILA|nr:hypothetical protein PMAYCL1PPCAC_23959 [Pristionchus mayeri]